MLPCLLLVLAQESAPASKPTEPPPRVTVEQVKHAGEVIGLAYTDEEARLMLKGVSESLASFEAMQKIQLDNSVPPALTFVVPPKPVRGMHWVEERIVPTFSLPAIARPADLEELAYASIPELASLIRSRKVSCLELTRMFLGRLKRLDETLHCVVTLTEERALAQATALDKELATDHWRGYLHGIPYGAKDLLAVKGYPTTWGSPIFQSQSFGEDAVVIRKLDKEGAVLIAKFSLGELAMGDVWFGGMTRNPWKLDQGSSGSSAGSAAATAAGCVAFAIGSETLGSIVSPSARCGCSSLRPTFGSISTAGAMALSWSMDKLGPLCRSVEDASIVYLNLKWDSPAGAPWPTEPITWSGISGNPRHFQPAAVDFAGRKIGYPAKGFERSKNDQHVLDELKALGAELVPIELPDYPVWDMMVILTAEAAASFDEITRDGRDDRMVEQGPDAWPNVFRTARLIPAVEYIRANRLRTLLMREMEQLMEQVDVVVHPSFGNDMLGIANLTGQPSVVLPSGFREDGTPRSICFTAQLHDEIRLLYVARNWQLSTEHHKRHPKL